MTVPSGAGDRRGDVVVADPGFVQGLLVHRFVSPRGVRWECATLRSIPRARLQAAGEICLILGKDSDSEYEGPEIFVTRLQVRNSTLSIAANRYMGLVVGYFGVPDELLRIALPVHLQRIGRTCSNRERSVSANAGWNCLTCPMRPATLFQSLLY